MGAVSVVETLEKDRLLAVMDARRLREERDALLAEVRDLKARLKAAREIHEHTVLREPLEEDLARVLDLRRKNWREP